MTFTTSSVDSRPADAAPAASGATVPTFGALLRVFARIGCISFGGPAGQIALMQTEIVEKHGWVDQGAFLRALNLCHLLPGPEAQQLATWIGWRLHGVRGGLAAGLLFVIPGALVMLGLSLLYVMAAGLPWLAGLFLGIKAAVLAIVAQALQRVAKRALTSPARRVIALVAFVALAALAAPFPLVILGAGVAGAIIGKVRPDWLGDGHAHAAAVPMARGALIGRTARTIVVWSAVWWAPMALVALTLGTGHPLWSVGTFFARLAVVSFGGAYAVLGYMAQATVGHYGWLTAADMANGMGLAETTPGPLIMVTQFVGFLAGWRNAAPLSALGGGLAAAALTTWMTFAPCFLWIFAAAPWLERLEHAPRLHAALAAITAAVVGVIASLALWFAIHVLLRGPGPTHPDWPALAIAAASAVLLFWRKWDIVAVLGVAAVAGLLLGLVT